MTAASDATTVVGSYEGRARFARAENGAVRRPRLLRLLESATHVAEIPCATGHFLSDYARAEATVTLVDANAAMLSIAVEHAIEVGLAADRMFSTLDKEYLVMTTTAPAQPPGELIFAPVGIGHLTRG